MQFADKIVNIDGINTKNFVVNIFDTIKKRHFETTNCSLLRMLQICDKDEIMYLVHTNRYSKSQKSAIWEKPSLKKIMFS